ncbi:TonB-dependent receptor [Novosphingobium sp. G106]|uniref:TonB-dependent receptor n=1 Tax=Novosphingobium sp. G106 TaxID=2849500 RepID=UPI001C2D036A|nr:TonB-dependent receptor [Novosphingobium sp. G106]MBV1691897.1 TonB-dependent receptor [Novosphingobium sp. G106]
MRKSAYLLGVAMLQVVSTPVFAQGAAVGADANGSDIIVTARRQEERLQDVPISITVLSQDAIADRNIVNAGDLGSYVPSLATNSNFGPERSSFSIRGFIQEGRTSPSVGVYFADVVAPRANSGTTSGNGAGVGQFFDLQNVQVLKGPQGTLFGRNTTGGAILLVPTKPTDRLEGYVEGTLGNYNERRIEAVLNIPLSDTFRLRAAVDRNKADGYLRNRSGIGPDRFADTNYVSARLSMVGDLTPDLETYTIARYSRSHTNGVLSKIISAGPYPGFPIAPGLGGFLAPLAAAQIARAQARGDGFWDVDNSVADPKEIQETWQVINTTTWKASDTLTVKNNVSYAEFKQDTAYSLFGDNYIYPAGYLANVLFPGFPGFPAGHAAGIQIKTGPSGHYASQSTFTEELQFQGNSADGRLNWQVGAYLEVSKPLNFNSGFNEIFIECTNPGAYQCSSSFLGAFGLNNISTANIKDSYNNKGLYGQATYKLTDKLSLTGGIRYTMDRMSDLSRNINTTIVRPGVATFSCQDILLFNAGTAANPIPVSASGPTGPECVQRIKISSNRPTWLIDVDYKPSNDLLLYAKYARGYRQGSIISNNFGFETFNPEKVDTFEAGAKTSVGGAVAGYFNIAAFYNNFTNQQIAVNSVVAPAYAAVIAPSQIIANAGKSRIWGIEVDASARPFQGLRLDLSYAYLNTKLISIVPPALPVFFSDLQPAADVGGPLAQSPKNRVTVTATYTLPLDESIGKISLGGTFTHTDANQVHTQRFAPTTFKVQAVDMLNLNASWDSVGGLPVDLSFFMTNVTNIKRYVYPIATYQTTGAESVYLNQPRMWGFRAKYRFGE